MVFEYPALLTRIRMKMQFMNRILKPAIDCCALRCLAEAGPSLGIDLGSPLSLDSI